VTQRPRHAVNDGLTVLDEDLPTVAAVDLALSLTRIETLHGPGTAARYRHFVGRAVAAQPDASRDELLTLAALAAWRAGAIGFRTDALRRLELALAVPDRMPGLAGALGLPPAKVADLAHRQRLSRFGWPGQEPGDLVAVLGGFRGLFGPWLAAPMAVLPGERPGSFVIRTARAGEPGDEWLVSIDVFGHTIVRIDPATAGHPLDTRWTGAGRSAAGLAEAGDPGGVLTVSGYTATLCLPEARS
jgi:hypothetical protein